MLFEQVCIIGLGLIGASLAQAIKDRQLAERLVAVDRQATSIDAAIEAEVISAGSDTLADVVEGCDCIIVAVPVKAVGAVFSEIQLAMQQGLISADCIISDVCSTKQNVVEAAKQVFGELPSGLVPAHPIAGAEQSGFNARRGDLFVNHSLIICPIKTTHPEAQLQISDLWQAVGATIMKMDVAHHDAVLAYTSHLPHLLAFNLVEQLASHDDNMDIFRYAAGGFRDFTRIAASDPVMWHDIFIANKPALLTALDEYSDYLVNLRHLIEQEDSTQLLGLLGRAQSARKHFGHMLTSTPYTKKLTETSHTENSMAQSTQASSTYIITPSRTIEGSIQVPGDKSISHRSIMFGSLAEGVTRVTGFLEGEDALATLQAFRDMGVTIEGPDNGNVVIHGVGINGLKPSRTPLYMGNSGTTMRLLSGILAAQKFDSVLTGDASLSKRPMERVAKPLREMGATLQTTGERGTAPISITGSDKRGNPLHGITYDMPVASAQVKSCLLLAGLWAEGTTTVIQPEISRDHTERMLSAFGYEVQVDGNRISVEGGGKLTACDIAVPADISSAAFFMVAASIAQNSEITITKVGMNPTRTGIIDILKLMNADISLSNETFVGGEPVADITIKSAQLKGIHIPEALVPLAIDEFPVLFVAASCASGQTVLTGAKELRVKESDRIAVMADGLTQLGVDCTVTEDGIIIEGKGVEGKGAATLNNDTKNATNHNDDLPAVFGGGEIYSHHDHRIAMSFAVASLRASDTITIKGVETVNTSFPGFSELANKIGMNIATRTL
ncbi:bifunctional prephenate dehydrogenase/3-phosphoshikimate 1-carboxyvinyltransferase [Psychrobacter sp. FDAARGOS_221]|uniref:bifunctional prephenate dehydrogenase/3-phosphoshikimate 1-carboxyvinyltransferase n=1 Tax=Psychrobacter sp. FDAARGOS_221 TaxID=1975705 RepID=UPI000BB5348A|nr:bifunctional prephenate dehydrogenase/3-phosphoshikimate 1-carboxyvinyltransferase [Psychrobacter sp. FDAARGOS_221]PNK59531.1 bifunctional prephenate dehydrogenase/3-phosphoshikimate 1-carboxyvinyltransferase [Psychrobacter sp. FDAARGOS_221]